MNPTNAEAYETQREAITRTGLATAPHPGVQCCDLCGAYAGFPCLDEECEGVHFTSRERA